MLLRNMPIRRKLIAIILLTSGVVMILMCVSFFTYEYLTLRQATVRQLSTLGNIICANSTAALAFANQSDAEEVLSALKAERHITAAALYDKNGKLFSKYPVSLDDSSLPVAPQTDGFQSEQAYLVGFQPVKQGDERLGTLYLKFDTGAVLQEWLRASISIAVVVMAVALLVAYLLSRKLQQQISQPILALAKTAESISTHRNFSVRAKKLGNDELGLLTDAFNKMLAEIHKLNVTLEQRVVERTVQLEAANRELQAFSYSVSHDLRAPLRHVLGFVELLQDDAGPSLSEKNLHYLTTITKAAKRMGSLIDDLLAFSRLGRAEMQKVDVDLDQLVQETLEDFQVDTKERRIVWDIHSLPTVWADRALLRMVLDNLVSNALKFTGARAEARIEIGSAPGGDGETVIFVRDNGAGFNQRYADKLFGVFQRLHSEKEFEGTGIGLANIQRIIMRHDGRAWAEGVVDGGATFYFSVPKPRDRGKNE